MKARVGREIDGEREREREREKEREKTDLMFCIFPIRFLRKINMENTARWLCCIYARKFRKQRKCSCSIIDGLRLYYGQWRYGSGRE